MANKKLNATIAIGGTVARSLTRGLTNTKGQLAEVGGEIGKTTRRQRQLSDQIKTFGRQGRNVDGLRRQYAELGTEIDRLRRKQESLQRLASANVGGRFSTMTNEVGRLARRTAMTGTVAAGTVFGVASSTAALGDGIAKTADKIGISTKALQELRYAGERGGMSVQGMDSAVNRFTRRLGRAAQGGGAAAKAYDALGLSAEALASMSPDEALAVTADRLEQVENHTDKLAYASAMFGNEGEGMLNVLRGGSEALRGYAADAARTGYILSEEATRDGEKFQDTLLDTQLSLKGLKNIVGAELMPVVGEMMGKFTGWLAENRDQVSEWSTTFATRLQAAIPVIMDLASGIGTVISKVGSAISTTADLVGGFDNLGMIIGAVIAGKAIGSIVMFGTAIFQAGGALLSLSGAMPLIAGGIKAIGAALMANPIGLIVAAIAGAGYLIYRNWEKIGPWFGKLWQGIQEKVAWAWDKVKGVIAWHPLALIARNWGAITDWFGRMGEGVKAAASTAWEGVKTVISWSPLGLIARAWSGLSDRVGGMAELAKAGLDVAWAAIKTVLSWSPLGLISAGWTPMANAVGNVVGIAKDMVSAVWDWMSAKLGWSPLETITGAWGGITGWFGNMWDGITASAAAAMDWITGKLEWVGSAFSKVKGWLNFGGDDDADDVRERLGGGNAGALNLGSSQEEAATRGQEVLQRGPARPQLSGGGASAAPAERSREVSQTITNHVQLHVTRSEGEEDQSYAERIAELVMDELNQRQQGALYDG